MNIQITPAGKLFIPAQNEHLRKQVVEACSANTAVWIYREFSDGVEIELDSVAAVKFLTEIGNL